jgi:RecB family exonuclease
MTFNWRVDASHWEPTTAPRPPLAVTAVETARLCGLQFRFSDSRDYERRRSFDSRVGSAFHRTMERLAGGIAADTPEAAARQAEAIFADELARQVAEADSAPREQRLPRDAKRTGRALEALMLEAQRVAASMGSLGDRSPDSSTGAFGQPARSGFGSEVQVSSADGWLKGRVDRVESSAAGTTIVDYKSGMRATQSEPYERQLQLYAAMWRDTYGSWPSAAHVIYPLIGISREIDVGEAASEAAAAEARRVVQRVVEERSPEALANPGAACRNCEFRPWCEPFWRYQGQGWMESETSQRAWLGIEGIVSELTVADHMVRMKILWTDKVVTAHADSNLMPHVVNVSAGDRVRLLEWDMRGQRHAPTVFPSPTGELFVTDARP